MLKTCLRRRRFCSGATKRYVVPGQLRDECLFDEKQGISVSGCVKPAILFFPFIGIDTVFSECRSILKMIDRDMTVSHWAGTRVKRVAR